MAKLKKINIDAISLAKEQIEEANHELEVATRHGDFQGASEIKFGKLPQLHKELEKQQQALADMQQDGGMLREEVTEEDIALVVSRWTGVPVNKLQQSEQERLIHMEDNLHGRVIGQHQAVVAVSDAVRRARSRSSRSKQTNWLLHLFGTYWCW